MRGADRTPVGMPAANIGGLSAILPWWANWAASNSMRWSRRPPSIVTTSTGTGRVEMASASRDQRWALAGKRYRLSAEHVRMARALGLNPTKLGKLDNHRQETWKAPLPQFIEDLY